MKRDFDFYEYAGIIAPGTALLLGLVYIQPSLKDLFGKDGVSVGEFGLFVMAAYVAGHLIQSIGNLLEWFWWKAWKGMPSDWLRTGKLLTRDQRHRVLSEVNQRFGLRIGSFDDLTQPEWWAITRQIYAAVAGGSRSTRIDIFNGNYGLTRGIAAACILLIPVDLFLAGDWHLAMLFGIAAIAALERMHRFGVHYARELFVQFLVLPQP